MWASRTDGGGAHSIDALCCKKCATRFRASAQRPARSRALGDVDLAIDSLVPDGSFDDEALVVNGLVQRPSRAPWVAGRVHRLRTAVQRGGCAVSQERAVPARDTCTGQRGA